MESLQKNTDDVSVTRIAAAYVICLLVVGLSVLNAFLHANSALIIAVCAAGTVIAVWGIVYCTRKFFKTLAT